MKKKSKEKDFTISWGEPRLCMDTKRDLEGLHLYMIRHGKKVYKNGDESPVVSCIVESLSEHVDRKRAKQIRDEIDRRLFGGTEYEGMPFYLK